MTIYDQLIAQVDAVLQNLPILRAAKRWTIGDLAYFSGIEADTLMRIEQGASPDIRQYLRLCAVYDIQPNVAFYPLHLPKKP